jgi:Tfp pilus assembly protein PilF
VVINEDMVYAMIAGYSKKGLWEKDEAFVRIVESSGMELNADSFVHLAAGYCVAGQMVKAAETMKKAISISTPEWKPNTKALAACLKCQGVVGSSRRAFQVSHGALSFRTSYL